MAVSQDHFGRDNFIVGSILCLWARSPVFLLTGRFLQGVGIASPAILSFLIIADLYPLKQQRFLMAMLNGSMNTAVAFAPVIGSYFTLYFHWQGNFMALLSLGLITLMMTMLFIPIYKLPHHRKNSLAARIYSDFPIKTSDAFDGEYYLCLCLIGFLLGCLLYCT